MNGRLDVLVVDDEPVVVDSARRVLVMDGLTVDTADSAETALEQLERRLCRVVLTDLMLPRVSGLQLVRQIQTRWPDLPVLTTTGYATPETAFQALAAGAFDFLPKPFDIDELAALVQRALAFNPAAAPPASGRHHLGVHAWVEPLGPDEVRIGPGESFRPVAGPGSSWELAARNDELRRGGEAGRLIARDGRTHTLRAPLSGRVVAVNPAPADETDPGRWAKRAMDWLVRLQPGPELAQELGNLSQR